MVSLDIIWLLPFSKYLSPFSTPVCILMGLGALISDERVHQPREESDLSMADVPLIKG